MILVTGATGMVGGHLLWHLLQIHGKVVAIRRSSSNLFSLRKIFCFYTDEPEIYLRQIDWRTADISDLNSLTEISGDIDVIYHCAAVVSLGGNQQDILEINVQGTKNMVDLALNRKIKQFCFVSSIASCGSNNQGILVDEHSPVGSDKLKSMYAQSKYFSEQVVFHAVEKGLNVVIVNPGVILGYTGMNSGSSQLFYRVKKGLPFYTPGGTGYVDVQDVVKIMITLMDKELYAEKYILVAENNSNQEILEWMADGFEKKRPFIYISEKMLFLVGSFGELFSRITGKPSLIDKGTAKSAVRRTWYSNEKIKSAIQYQFKPVKQTVIEICEFINQND